MSDRVLAEAALGALDAAIAGLLSARKLLGAALREAEPCQHANRISLATFGSPEAWTCPDCGVSA